jgi:hypothetical protein
MRILLILLLIGGLAFADLEALGQEMIKCDKTCCTSNGGTWDSVDLDCSIQYNDSNYDSYMDCYENCVNKAFESYDTTCCFPAFLLVVLVGFVAMQS